MFVLHDDSIDMKSMNRTHMRVLSQRCRHAAECRGLNWRHLSDKFVKDENVVVADRTVDALLMSARVAKPVVSPAWGSPVHSRDEFGRLCSPARVLICVIQYRSPHEGVCCNIYIQRRALLGLAVMVGVFGCVLFPLVVWLWARDGMSLAVSTVIPVLLLALVFAGLAAYGIFQAWKLLKEYALLRERIEADLSSGRL